jgi:putative transcription factor
MYEHQDWNTVVLKKKKTDAEVKQERVKKHVGNTGPTMSSTTNKPAWKIEKQVDDENSKPVTYVSKQDSSAIMKARLAMKLSQKDLAQRLNMQFKDIQDIENGKYLENKAIISKIKRVLHI